MQGTEVKKPGDSKFNPVWAAGIELLLAQRYKAAAVKLSEANQLVPNLTDMKHLLRQAEEKVKNPPPQPFPWALTERGLNPVLLDVRTKTDFETSPLKLPSRRGSSPRRPSGRRSTSSPSR